MHEVIHRRSAVVHAYRAALKRFKSLKGSGKRVVESKRHKRNSYFLIRNSCLQPAAVSEKRKKYPGGAKHDAENNPEIKGVPD